MGRRQTQEGCIIMPTYYYRPRSEASEGYVFTGVRRSLCSTRGGGSAPCQGRPPPCQADPLAKVTPRRPQQGIRSIGGRYASYWNAYLFSQFYFLETA